MIDSKELLKALGLPEELAEKPIEETTEAFHSEWVSRKLADTDPDIKSRVTGKVLGSIQALAAREFGLEPDEVKDKKVEDYIKIAASKHKAKLTELEESLKNGDASEWQKKLEKVKTEANQYKELANTLKTEKETIEADFSGKLKATKLSYAVGSLKSKLPYSDEFASDELRKKGFDAHIGESFNFDFDDSDNLVVTDKKGQQIPNASKNGFLSPEDLLKTELAKHKGLKIVNTQTQRTSNQSGYQRKEEPEPLKINGQTRQLPTRLRK